MHSRGPDRRSTPNLVSLAELGLEQERRKGDDRRYSGFISRLQLFATIPYGAVEAAIADAPVHNVAAGEILLVPGQANDAIHLLISGRLRIHLDHADSADYIPIEEGGCFGELSIIDGRPVSAYVVADQPSRIVTVSEQVVWDRLVTHPGVARNLLKVLSERMRLNGDIILAQMKDKLALELLQKELSIAHDIQLAMLPPGDQLFQEHPEVSAYAIMEPAKNIGGDFYDAFVAAPGRLFFAIGDVSGKGVPAALFMARAITQMRMEAVRRRSATAVLEAVNRALCIGNDAGMFVTLFCGILDLETGTFTFANAGHNPPVLINENGEHKFIEVKKGLVAGIMDNSRYPAETLQIAPGQTLLLYTDGVTEAMNTADNYYSEKRLLAAIAGASADDPRTLIDAIHASIFEFARNAPQADDITMFALSYRGAAYGKPVDAERV